MYVNNFLTLLVWRGELAAADRIVELNVRALSWIAEPWQHRWQIEHGFSSLGYLRTLQGDLEMASDLFDYAAQAWDDYDGERLWIYDYYPYYRSEAIYTLPTRRTRRRPWMRSRRCFRLPAATVGPSRSVAATCRPPSSTSTGRPASVRRMRLKQEWSSLSRRARSLPE